MTKITPSALVDNITGSLKGSTFKGHPGGIVMMGRGRPRQPRSAAQMKRRGHVNKLSGDYNALSDTQKKLWERYASLAMRHSSGFDAYMSLNLNLFDGQVPSPEDVTVLSVPPLTPGTPDNIEGFSVTIKDDVQNDISWASPLDANIYIVIHFAVQSGFSHDGKESWHVAGTPTTAEPPYHHFHSYPIGSIFSYKAYTLDLYGRKSPSTETLKGPLYQALHLPGRYGYTPYGYSTYGF